MFEIVIVIAIALAAWLFVHFRKKKHASAAETTVAQKVPTESKRETEPKPTVSIKTAEVGGDIDVVPEDSALRRHYLQNIAALEGASNSEEADEVEPVSHESETIEVKEPVDVVPEDSALRRHYLQNLAALDDTVSVVEEDVVEDELVAEVFVTEESDSLDVVSNNPVSGIPEDSALKRHFIQQLVAKTEATMSARPTDSTLKRHYEAQLMSAVNSQLQALK